MAGQVWPAASAVGVLYAKVIDDVLRNNLIIGREAHERRQREWEALPEHVKRARKRAAKIEALRERLAKEAYERISGRSFPDDD
jgi:ABC-type phosphate transport system ATPase subunit